LLLCGEIKLFRKRNGIKVFIGLLSLVALNACATHTKNKYDKNAYDRANKASEKALDKLDRE